MNKYVTIQVADIRFAIRCNYLAFLEWLTEKCSGFVSQGEPHLRMNIRFDIVPKGLYDIPFLYFARNGHHCENGEVLLGIAWSNPAHVFRPMLNICLRCAILAKQQSNMLLHSAGIVHGGTAYLFTGVSGSGKSTICKLLSKEPDFIILNDEVVAISKMGENFYAWSTPFRGELPAKYNVSAPLRAVFFLKHDQTNFAVKLNGRKAAELFYPNVVSPMVITNGNLEIKAQESLRLALELAARVPCYELHFRQEHGFWDCIPQLLEKESAMTQRKG